MGKGLVIIFAEHSFLQHLSEAEWISVILYIFIRDVMNNFLNIPLEGCKCNNLSEKISKIILFLSLGQRAGAFKDISETVSSLIGPNIFFHLAIMFLLQHIYREREYNECV